MECSISPPQLFAQSHLTKHIHDLKSWLDSNLLELKHQNFSCCPQNCICLKFQTFSEDSVTTEPSTICAILVLYLTMHFHLNYALCYSWKWLPISSATSTLQPLLSLKTMKIFCMYYISITITKWLFYYIHDSHMIKLMHIKWRPRLAYGALLNGK